MNLAYDFFDFTIGRIYIVMDGVRLKNLFLTQEGWNNYEENNTKLKLNKESCEKVITQLKEYFSGDRYEFNVPLFIEGTEFNKKVWSELLNIPYGEFYSYSDISKKIGNSKAYRAVGQASRRNPIPIIIPCHRVVGKTGKLTGYLGDRVEIKKYLIEMERSFKLQTN